MRRLILSLIPWLLFGRCYSQHDFLFNTCYLRNPLLIEHYLKKKCGFKEGFLNTSDDCKLHYLWLERPQASYTMIFASGFYPGNKEGLSTFYKIVPEDCNILFFDWRGHGKSTGKFLSALWQYGQHEWKDVVAAIDFVHTKVNKPIVLYGLCAGAFHSVNALMFLGNDKIEKLGIKGLIFDSGWSSLNQISETFLIGHLQSKIKKLPKLTQVFIKNLSKNMIKLIHYGTIKPILHLSSSKKTDILPRISILTIPILYIHAYDDTYASIDCVQVLAEQTLKNYTWWIAKPSKHACNHLKHTIEYANRLSGFIKAIVT